MFKFFPDEKTDGDEESPPCEDEGGSRAAQKKELRSAGEVVVKQLHYDIARDLPTTKVKHPASASTLKYIRIPDLLESSYVKGQPKVREILGSTSDLLTGEYEGIVRSFC
jgi:hypothetical protein